MGSFTLGQPTSTDYWSQFQPHNTGVTGGMLGGVQPANPSQQSQQPIASTDMGMPPTSAPGPTLGAPQGGDPKQIALDYARSLGPPTDENIAKTAAYMQSLGYDVKPNPGSDGFWLNGQGWDIVQGYKSGNPSWQQPLIDGQGGGTLGNPAAMGTIGAGAGQMAGMIGGTGANDIINTPGLQFALNQAQSQIEHGAAARGTLLTGGLQKGIGSYLAQSMLLPEYHSRVNDLFNLTNLGYGAAGAMGNYGNSYANNATALQTGIGNAQAAGTIGVGNAIGSAIGGVINAAGQRVPSTGSSYPGGRGPNADPFAANGATDQYAANQYGYNPNGVNGYGVNYTQPS